MKEKEYKIIFFDWSMTLSKSLFWSQLADKKHPRHHWHDNIISYVFKKNDSMVKDWMTGHIDMEFVAKSISQEFGYSKDLVLSDLIESSKGMKLVDRRIIKMINTIRERGTKCVIATDNMDTFIKYTRPSLCLDKYFDDFLVSYNMGIMKFNVTDSQIPFFDDYLQQEKVKYEDVLLIDDSCDTSGVYNKLGFDILQILNSADFVEKLTKIAFTF